MGLEPEARAFDKLRFAGALTTATHSMNRVASRSNLRPAKHAHSHKGGLRTVAVFEALKGLLALVSAYFLIVLIRRDVDFGDAALHVLFSLHISPSHHWTQEFLRAANKMSDINVMMVAALAVTYATLRFVEGYGLWKQRAWAEWLAIVSGCIYIPFEVYKVVRRPNELHLAILGINILVVLYIGWVRWEEIKLARERATAVPHESG
ncbi:MAG: DUF2127 domain-containing protein [Candidatus Korobacteraceae bacterium]